MINVIHADRRPLLIRSASHLIERSLNPTSRQITCTILFFFQFRIQILTHVSNFHVTWWLSYRSNTCDVVGRVSCSRTDFDVAATSSSRASRSEFQQSSLTFRPEILESKPTSTWRASPAVENASVDNTDAAATFFTTDGKTYIRAFQFLYS
jgi:hypothetical protein